MNQYSPMLARDADVPFTSPDWIFEVKWDGIRALSYVNDRLSIRSRTGRELKHKFPELEELENLASKVVLDGEIIVMRDGEVDFQSVLSRNQAREIREIERMARELPATYIVFDILEKDGEPLTAKPLIERKEVLKDSLEEGRHVVISDFIEEKGEVYYGAAIRKGLEGVIAKKKNSRYQSGRSNNWLKFKEVKTCDCVILGYTKGKGSREKTFGALLLGLYRDEELVYVGRVGTGFTEADLERLKPSFQPLEVKERTIKSIDLHLEVTWLKPELVCEIRYKSVTREGMLRMARFRGLKANKNPRDCGIDQIKPLEEYMSKRDFERTPEPKGGKASSTSNIFVVQEHHARRLHYDLRLEKEGVLKSWAVPKGPPENIGDRRLAIETEDHPIEYARFEGTIPKGEYGAGVVKIWDRGIYKTLGWNDEKIEFILSGRRLNGRYVLIRFKRAGEKEWLIIKAEG